jgi:hypothetical protein
MEAIAAHAPLVVDSYPKPQQTMAGVPQKIKFDERVVSHVRKSPSVECVVGGGALLMSLTTSWMQPGTDQDDFYWRLKRWKGSLKLRSYSATYLICWLVGWLVGWLLIGWLVGWLDVDNAVVIVDVVVAVG